MHVAGEDRHVEVEAIRHCVAMVPRLDMQVGCDEEFHGRTIAPARARGKD
jgi:hypothetical protein